MPKLPRLVYPRRIERRYASLLLVYLLKMERDVTQQVLSLYASRQDGTDEEDEIASLINRLTTIYSISTPQAAKIAQNVYLQIDAHHLGDFNATYGEALGLTTAKGTGTSGTITNISPKTETAIGKAFVKENVGLIKSIPQQTLGQVKEVVRESLAKGSRVETLAKRLRERFGVAESRARLIARDQVGKYYGQLNAKRQTDAGVESFEWSSSGDERVRSKHRQINGKIYKYPDGHATEGLPGQPVQCRCSAIPEL